MKLNSNRNEKKGEENSKCEERFWIMELNII